MHSCTLYNKLYFFFICRHYSTLNRVLALNVQYNAQELIYDTL
jgi:hypothetical protein